MTRKQQKMISRLEFALANFVFDGKKELASIWSLIIEAMHKGEFVWAVILASQADIPKPLVEHIRKTFNINRIE